MKLVVAFLALAASASLASSELRNDFSDPTECRFGDIDLLRLKLTQNSSRTALGLGLEMHGRSG